MFFRLASIIIASALGVFALLAYISSKYETQLCNTHGYESTAQNAPNSEEPVNYTLDGESQTSHMLNGEAQVASPFEGFEPIPVTHAAPELPVPAPTALRYGAATDSVQVDSTIIDTNFAGTTVAGTTVAGTAVADATVTGTAAMSATAPTSGTAVADATAYGADATAYGADATVAGTTASTSGTLGAGASMPSAWAVREIGLATEAGLITESIAKEYSAIITREQFCELLLKLYDGFIRTHGDPGSGTGNVPSGGRTGDVPGGGFGGRTGDVPGTDFVSGSNANTFKDTENPEVLRAFELGLASGKTADEFFPHDYITRQEMCVMIVRCIGKAIPGANTSIYKKNDFTDSGSIAEWAEPYVNYAFDHKIISGISENTIAPANFVTCEQAVLFAYRALIGDYEMKTSPFEFVDGHADSITAAMRRGQTLFSNNLHVDIERLMEYKTPVQVFAIYCADAYVDDAYEYANSAIDFFESELAKHSEVIELALSLDDLERNAKNNKISAILALEGGEPLAGNIENIDHFYERGVRLISLTWNRENELGYGVSTGSESGLKPFGFDAVKRMNELGIIVDVSHLNEEGFWDVHELSAKPYIASHSNAYSITPHRRNLKDSQIMAIVERGGIIGINLYPLFLNSGGGADINNIIKHINHFVSLGAGGNIGLGSDFDGFTTMPRGFSDVSSHKMLAREIAARIDPHSSYKVMSGNYYDFFVRFFE